jgi:septal ring factor EnvC (AmiA/AmiB activator)
MIAPYRRPVTPADVEATRHKLCEMAAEFARTEDRIADTFERLIALRGDPDGHRQRIVDEARQVAALQRQRAAGALPRADGD